MNRKEKIVILLRTLEAAEAGPQGSSFNSRRTGEHESRPLHESTLWRQGSYSELCDALWHLHRFTTAHKPVRDIYINPRIYVDPNVEQEDYLLARKGVEYLDKVMPEVIRVPECFRPYRKKISRDDMIRKLHIEGMSQRKIANQFSISQSRVHQIVRAPR